MISRVQRIPDADRALFLEIRDIVLGIPQDVLESLRSRIATDEENGISSALVCVALSKIFNVQVVHGNFLMEAPCSWIVTEHGLIIAPIQPLFPLVGPICIMNNSFFVTMQCYFREDIRRTAYISVLGAEFRKVVEELEDVMRSHKSKK
jgi:hypothetical protein